MVVEKGKWGHGSIEAGAGVDARNDEGGSIHRRSAEASVPGILRGVMEVRAEIDAEGAVGMTLIQVVESYGRPDSGVSAPSR